MRKLLFNVIITSIFICFGWGYTVKDTIKTTQKDSVVIGVIHVTGNEPFTKLMISTETGKHIRINADSALYRQLWRLQNKRIIITGTLQSDTSRSEIFVRHYQLAQ